MENNTNDFQGGAHGQDLPEPWHPESSDSEDELEDDMQEEDEVVQEADDASNYTDLTDEEDNPRSRPRARTSKSKSKTCSECQKIKDGWNREVEQLRDAFRAEERKRNVRINELKDKIKELRERGRLTWNPWAPRLNTLIDTIRNNQPEDTASYPAGYGLIYSDSCKQGNMSPNPSICHPDLFLDSTVYSPAAIKKHYLDQVPRTPFDSLNLEGIHRPLRSIVLPERFTRLKPLRFLEKAPFQFESLPIDIQCRIWKYLVPNDELVHCLSRLDHRNPPLDCQPGKVHYPSRFHVGNELCCVAKADKPSRYLDYLLVSKRWYYATAHLFYSTNTFAFSSLGEFGRFCSGIGKSRVARLVNIEIMWTGALMPRKRRGLSLRKEPLCWLMHTSRLRTLCVHINESAPHYMRRRCEMMGESDGSEDFANSDTEEDTDSDVPTKYFQCNSWRNRSLRTVQGMDFIYQLRDMRWVRFYDTNKESPRTSIADKSFLMDVNNQVTRPKPDKLAKKTHIHRLRPLTGLRGFAPDAETAELVRRFYGDAPLNDACSRDSGTPSSEVDSDDDLELYSRNLSRRPYGGNKTYMGRNVDIDDRRPTVIVIDDDDDDNITVNADADLDIKPPLIDPERGGSDDPVLIASDASSFDSDSDSGCDSKECTKRAIDEGNPD